MLGRAVMDLGSKFEYGLGKVEKMARCVAEIGRDVIFCRTGEP